MKHFPRTLYALILLVGLFYTLNTVFPSSTSPVQAKQPEEVRAIWAATVYGLDYPVSPTTSADSLRCKADELLQNVEDLGYNTLFFQVRPSGDALYKSEIYPWSKYLTGTQGTAPSDNFDPLEYITVEGRKRGISVHAWINPYRLTSSASDESALSADSIPKKYPHLVVKNSDGKLYLNPGEPESIDLTVKGVQEILKNYDVDGIHIDDYFYPEGNFPDSETFAKYGSDFTNIGDWRRNNTTSLVKALGNAIRTENKDVVFSVSPCGIWANKSENPLGSDTSGAQAYSKYYADTRLWVKENMIDWIIPQIYWNIGYKAADFKILANWWSDTVKGTNVSLCIGQAFYKATDETNSASAWYGQKGLDELSTQAELLRNLDGCIGYSHYRLGSVIRSDAIMAFAQNLNTTEVPVFSDLNGFSWAEGAILTLYEKGVLDDIADKTFDCSTPISRADFTVMLVRILGVTAEVDSNFEDITPDKYYYKEIGIAKALGISNGRDGIIFDPDGRITREEMATLVYRILNEKNLFSDIPDTEPTFSDSHKISPYAIEAVNSMSSAKLLNGYETGEFLPQGLTTRAEAAVFLNRISDFINK